MSSTSSGSSVSSSSDSSSSSGGGGGYSPISSASSGYIASGSVQTANNALDGDPEYSIGGSSSQGQCVWDNNISGGFDSGNTSFEFTADLTGTDGITLGVDHPTATGIISGSLGISGGISRLQVLAIAQSGGRFQFHSLRAEFYNGGTLERTIDVPADSLPDADGTGGTNSTQGLEFSPGTTGYNNVHILGVFQMTDPTPDTIPNLQCRFLVFN